MSTVVRINAKTTEVLAKTLVSCKVVNICDMILLELVVSWPYLLRQRNQKARGEKRLLYYFKSSVKVETFSTTRKLVM